MPLEIKELAIRIIVNQPLQAQQVSTPIAPDPNKREEEREEIISQCLDGVIEILKQKKER